MADERTATDGPSSLRAASSSPATSSGIAAVNRARMRDAGSSGRSVSARAARIRSPIPLVATYARYASW